MELKPGLRLESATCDTQVVVVRAPKEATDVDVRCGGHPMRDSSYRRSSAVAGDTPRSLGDIAPVRNRAVETWSRNWSPTTALSRTLWTESTSKDQIHPAAHFLADLLIRRSLVRIQPGRSTLLIKPN